MADFQLEIQPETREKMAAIEALFSNEDSFVVRNQTELDYVSDLVKRLKAAVKEVEKDRSDLTSPLESAKKAIIAEFKPLQDRCAEIEKKCKAAMNAYLDEQDRLRRVEQAKADEKARRERERLESRALAAAEKGQAEKAEELAAQALSKQAPVVAETQKPQGVTGRVLWSAECVNKDELIIAAAANPFLRSLLVVDQKRLDDMAKAMNTEFSVPGCVASARRSLAIRA